MKFGASEAVRKTANLLGSSNDQERLVSVEDVEDRSMQAYKSNKSYKPEYAKMAFSVLSSGPFKTKAHLCVAFACHKRTLLKWIREEEDFRDAVELGLSIGEASFRDACNDRAWMSSSETNNGLIKLMAMNVYGIKDEFNPAVVIENKIITPEQEMKERGIPFPDVDCDDEPPINTPANRMKLKEDTKDKLRGGISGYGPDISGN